MTNKITVWFEKIKKDHGLMMIICCVVPIIILFVALKFFSVNKSYIAWIILLLCPLMHFFMMKDMHKEHKTDNTGVNNESNKNTNNERNKGGGCH